MPKFKVELYRNVCQTKHVEVEAENKEAVEKIVNGDWDTDTDTYDKYWMDGWEDDSIRESMIITSWELE